MAISRFEEVRRQGQVAANLVGASLPPEPAVQPFSGLELQVISAQISANWFQADEPTQLTLMEIDPWRVHAYWSLSPADISRMRDQVPAAGDASLVLRFTDLSPHSEDLSSHQCFDIPVQGHRNNWYIDLWQDAKRYKAELGLVRSNGELISLASSNEVETPRGNPSPELDFQQLEVRAPRALEFNPATATAVPDAALLNLFPLRKPLDGLFPEAMSEPTALPLEEPTFPILTVADEDSAMANLQEFNSNSAYTPDPDVNAKLSWQASALSGGGFGPPYFLADFPAIEESEIAPFRLQAEATRARILDGMLTMLPATIEEIISPIGIELIAQPLPIPATAEGEYRRPQGGIHALGEGDFPVVTAAAITALQDKPLEGKPGLAADDPAWLSSTWVGETPNAAHPGPLETAMIPLEELLGTWVFSSRRGSPPLDLQVELHIYGKGDPNLRVSLFGEPLPIAEDGSLSVKLPLTKGAELAALFNQLRALKQQER